MSMAIMRRIVLKVQFSSVVECIPLKKRLAGFGGLVESYEMLEYVLGLRDIVSFCHKRCANYLGFNYVMLMNVSCFVFPPLLF